MSDSMIERLVSNLFWLVPVIGLITLSVAWSFYRRIKAADPGSGRMVEVHQAIREGAFAFIRREYLTVAIVLAILIILLAVFLGWEAALSALVGAAFSLLAGFIGMSAATIANVRTARAAEKGAGTALAIAFPAGAVMGLTVVGLNLIGIALLYVLFGHPELITGYGLGASLVALFARFGGGIFTKAADVGADLVGKVEAGIPEDDPRNPAVIADNVGDNVGLWYGRRPV
jgi:K(+)-stimulated pyrophosphate-energized sodium pump